MQLEVEMLNEIALQVQEGELEGFEAFGTLLALSALIEEVDKSLPDVEPLPELRGPWDDLTGIHEEIKGIISRWVNDEIDSSRVVGETNPLLENAESALNQAETVLEEDYDLPSAELTSRRQELMREVSNAVSSESVTVEPMTVTPED
jgi:hypothetical protein